MLKTQVKAAVREAGECCRVIDIQGEVNAQAGAVLVEAYTQAAASPARAVLLNFSGLDYMNSSGIGVLVTLLVRAQRQKVALLACGLNEHYQAIFDLTRLNEAIPIYPSEAQAIQAVQDGLEPGTI